MLYKRPFPIQHNEGGEHSHGRGLNYPIRSYGNVQASNSRNNSGLTPSNRMKKQPLALGEIDNTMMYDSNMILKSRTLRDIQKNNFENSESQIGLKKEMVKV